LLLVPRLSVSWSTSSPCFSTMASKQAHARMPVERSPGAILTDLVGLRMPPMQSSFSKSRSDFLEAEALLSVRNFQPVVSEVSFTSWLPHVPSFFHLGGTSLAAWGCPLEFQEVLPLCDDEGRHLRE
jgi:hypothetical protein